MLYAMNANRMARAKKDILIMAPGPINRGVEITPDVADGPHSVILNQVTNGLAVRMAAWLVGHDKLCADGCARSRASESEGNPGSHDASLLIKNGRVIDPSQPLDRVTNLLIEGGRIAAIDGRRAGASTR